MTLYQLYLSRALHMSRVDQQQAYAFLEHLYTYPEFRAPEGFYGRSVKEMISDQPDGFATE